VTPTGDSRLTRRTAGLGLTDAALLAGTAPFGAPTAFSDGIVGLRPPAAATVARVPVGRDGENVSCDPVSCDPDVAEEVR